MITEVEVNAENREVLISILNSLKELINVNTVNEDIKTKLFDIQDSILFEASIKKYFIHEYQKKEQKLTLEWFIKKYDSEK